MNNGAKLDFAGHAALGENSGLDVPVRAGRTIAGCLIAAAMFIAVTLRWYHLGELSIWWDESMTAIGARLSTPDVVRFVRADTFPPLYFLLQHYWELLFGNSETALRGLSAFCGTVSVPVFYLLARKFLHDLWAVALAMWTFAFSEMLLWYSREARPYALVSFLALVSLYALIRFLENRSVTWFAIVVLAVDASLYSHTMMFLYLLAINVAWLTYPAARSFVQRLKELFLADFLVLLFYLPWVPSLLAQVAAVRRSHGTWTLPRPTITDFFSTLAVISGFNFNYLIAFGQKLLPLSPHTLGVGITVALSLLWAALVIGGLWRVPQPDRSRNVALLLYCLVPMIAAFVFSLVATPVFVNRVLIDSAAVVPIVLAYPLVLRTGRRVQVFYVFCGIALAAITALSGLGFLRYQQKENWRAATQALLTIPEKNRLIVFVARSGEGVFDYYARRFPAESSGFTKMALPNSYLDASPPPSYSPMTSENDFRPLKSAVESGKYSEIDLVLSHEQIGDPDSLVLNYLNRALVNQGGPQFYGVKIVRFLAPPQLR
jgi:mannosyltransferase